MEKLPSPEEQARASELLNLEYMSSEVTHSEEEEENRRQNKPKFPKPRKVLKLKWESQEATDLKRKLDELYLTKLTRKDFLAKMGKVTRRENAFSTRTVNKDCPDWIKKAD